MPSYFLSFLCLLFWAVFSVFSFSSVCSVFTVFSVSSGFSVLTVFCFLSFLSLLCPHSLYCFASEWSCLEFSQKWTFKSGTQYRSRIICAALSLFSQFAQFWQFPLFAQFSVCSVFRFLYDHQSVNTVSAITILTSVLILI